MNFGSLDYRGLVVSVHKGQLEKFSSQTRAYLIIPRKQTTILPMSDLPDCNSFQISRFTISFTSDYVIFLFQLPSAFKDTLWVFLSLQEVRILKHEPALTFTKESSIFRG